MASSNYSPSPGHGNLLLCRFDGGGASSPDHAQTSQSPQSLQAWGARPDVTARDQQQMLLAMRAFYGAPSRTFAQNKAAVHLQNIITGCVIRQRATQRVRTAWRTWHTWARVHAAYSKAQVQQAQHHQGVLEDVLLQLRTALQLQGCPVGPSQKPHSRGKLPTHTQ